MCLSGSSPQGREPVHAARTAVCLVTVRHSSSVVHRRIVTFGSISFHLVERALVPVSGVPLLYAGAMAALVTGCVYDRLGGQILLTLPFIVAAIRPLAFGGSLAAVVVGVLRWGAAVGVQDSTVKALVAHLVKRERRAATAYGISRLCKAPALCSVVSSLERSTSGRSRRLSSAPQPHRRSHCSCSLQQSSSSDEERGGGRADGASPESPELLDHLHPGPRDRQRLQDRERGVGGREHAGVRASACGNVNGYDGGAGAPSGSSHRGRRSTSCPRDDQSPHVGTDRRSAVRRRPCGAGVIRGSR
jgi:hypothetical protein